MSKFNQFLLVILFSLPVFFSLRASTPLQTMVTDAKIRTLTVTNSDNWLFPPIIDLSANNAIEISFDEVTPHPDYYSYTIIHCDANWQQSAMSDLEFLDGFNNNPLDESYPSFNTFTGYVHYSLALPNDKVNFKLSGNYAVCFYRTSDPTTPVATACFYVAEMAVSVFGSVLTDTDVSFRGEYQQLNLRVSYPNYQVRDPQGELKVVVEQNNRPDTRVMVTNPLSVRGAEMVYEHNKNLIFEGGNEYRRFETVSSKYPGIGVDFIRFNNQLNGYYATLFAAESRKGKSYLYDQDQNGRYLVRDVNASDNNTEADYFYVKFTYPTELPFLNGRLYLVGEFTNNRIDPAYEVRYNPDVKAYEYEALLKQGAYNYLYVVVPNDTKRPTVLPMEGSHWETENEYLALVYHRPFGARYDKLVGYGFIKSR